jgi:hypothetical protein
VYQNPFQLHLPANSAFARLGAGWSTSNLAGYTVNRLDGLGSLMFANRGLLLFISNNMALLTAVVNQGGATSPITTLTYAAGFRHEREHSNSERIMTALDFGAGGPSGVPPFFSANIGSLGRTLANVADVEVTQREQNGVTLQRVVYQTTL